MPTRIYFVPYHYDRASRSFREMNRGDLAYTNPFLCVESDLNLSTNPLANFLFGEAGLRMPLPEGVRFVGWYYPTVYLDASGERFVVSEIGLPTPAAALDVAQAWIDESNSLNELAGLGRVDPIFLQSSATPPNFANYTGVTGEKVGDRLSISGSTKGDYTISSSCSKCGMIGHNSRTCETILDIAKVGIEIEGRWKRNNWESYEAKGRAFGATHCGDGSIRSKNDYICKEFQTKAGSVAQALRQLVDLYPEDTGPDCGMHVHVSFNCETYFSQLSTQAFYDYFKGRWEAWGTKMNLHPQGEFFKRLSGQNSFCLPNAYNSRQNPYTEDRYRQLNFGSYSEHRTIECRLLPMFRDKTLAVAAVLELISIYKDWFAAGAESLQLPEENFRDIPHDFGAPIAETTEVNLSSRRIQPISTTLSAMDLDIQPVAPVAEGMRRIAASPNQLQALRLLGIAA